MNKIALSSLLLALSVLLPACAPAGNPPQTSGSAFDDEAESYYEYPVEAEDLDDSEYAPEMTIIRYEGQQAEIIGPGAVQEASAVMIREGGVYRLSGTAESGSVQVCAPDAQTVKLILDGLSLCSKEGPALRSTGGGKLILTLSAGTANALTGGACSDPQGQNSPAALQTDGALTLNGGGALSIQSAPQGDGITAEGRLLLLDGSLQITAAGAGLCSGEALYAAGGFFTVDSLAQAIQAADTVYLQDGVFSLQTGGSSVQAGKELTISGGVYNVTAGKTETGKAENSSIQQSSRQKATAAGVFSAGTSMTLRGGAFTIDGAGGSRSDGSISASHTLNAADYGFQCDGILTIDGAEIVIESCETALFAQSVDIKGGTVSISAVQTGVRTTDSFSDEEKDSAAYETGIMVSGGQLSIQTQGDGVASSGFFTLTGGVVLVETSARSQENSAFTWNPKSRCTLSGGSLAVLSAGAAIQAPSSAQGMINAVLLSLTTASGQKLQLKDQNANEIFVHTPSFEVKTMLLCLPALQTGVKYGLICGDVLQTQFTITGRLTVAGNSKDQSGQSGEL